MGEIEGEGRGIGPCRISQIELHSETKAGEEKPAIVVRISLLKLYGF